MFEAGRQFAFLFGAKNHDNFFEVRNIADHLYQGSRSIKDPDVNQLLQDKVHNQNLKDVWHYQKIFVENFESWIELDLSNFEPDFSAGTTQSFDSFYFRHRNRKFRCYTGEYFYHLKTWIANNVSWSFISDTEPLHTGDALVISYPFCDTGNFYDLESILQICEEFEIPVLIDMAYYPLTSAPKVQLTSKAIDTIAFSLSKVFPVANYRIGVRYTPTKIKDGQKLHSKINYNNFYSCYIGQELINNFSRCYIYDTYNAKQKKVADLLGLSASDSVIFAIGNSNWDRYGRRTLLSEYDLDFSPELFVNRICLNSLYENWNLFTAVQDELKTEI